MSINNFILNNFNLIASKKSFSLNKSFSLDNSDSSQSQEPITYIRLTLDKIYPIKNPDQLSTYKKILPEEFKEVIDQQEISVFRNYHLETEIRSSTIKIKNRDTHKTQSIVVLESKTQIYNLINYYQRACKTVKQYHGDYGEMYYDKKTDKVKLNVFKKDPKSQETQIEVFILD